MPQRPLGVGREAPEGGASLKRCESTVDHDLSFEALAKEEARRRRGGGTPPENTTITTFFFRQGLHFGSQNFHPRHDASASDADIMAAFLAQFYSSRLPPREMLLSVMPAEPELLADALALTLPYRPELRVPERGDKRTLMEDALAQARAAHERAQTEAASVMEHLAALRELLGLADIPERIEIFDNSHIAGTHQLGAMVVATREGFKKSAYRVFNRKSADTIAGDDLSMMREMMRRRFGAVRRESEVMEREEAQGADHEVRGGTGRRYRAPSKIFSSSSMAANCSFPLCARCWPSWA